MAFQLQVVPVPVSAIPRKTNKMYHRQQGRETSEIIKRQRY